MLKRLNRRQHVPANDLKRIRNQDKDQPENPSRSDEQISEAASTIPLSNGWKKKKLHFVHPFS